MPRQLLPCRDIGDSSEKVGVLKGSEQVSPVTKRRSASSRQSGLAFRSRDEHDLIAEESRH